MRYNKNLVITAIIVFGLGLIIAIATVFSQLNQPLPSEEPPKENTSSVTDLSLRIDNFSSYPKIDDSTRTLVTDSIDRYLVAIPHTETPVGSVREGSYKETVDGSVSNTTFLVDIANMKVSYKISIGSDSSTGEKTMYTLCPEAGELIYPPFECKDDLSEE
jgi:cytoskeletal protein RodZ